MDPKPAHLSSSYASQFEDGSVVSAYRHRPPYPPQAIDVLLDLLPSGPREERRVLDVGCGTGDLSLPMPALGWAVDGLDPSPAMLAAARSRQGAECVCWILGRIEEAVLSGPYALITAAESLHWTDWARSLPRLAQLLAPEGRLVLLDRQIAAPPWGAGLRSLIARHSTNRDYAPYDLVDELTRRGLFVEEGRLVTEPNAFHQPLSDYIESFHSRNGFSRQRMSEASARSFDEALASLVRAHVGDGPVELFTTCRLIWGRPAG